MLGSIGFGSEKGDPEEGVEVLLEEALEGFLKRLRGDRQLGDVVGRESEKLEVGHGD
jgi:hypothetical protein